MKPTRSACCGTALAALVMLVTGLGTSFADAPPDKKDPPKPLPKEILEAWKKAGAEVSWVRQIGDDNLLFRPGTLEVVPEAKGEVGDQPRFKFLSWKKGVLAKLPDPGIAFSLDLSFFEMTDAGLKDLAGLKSLQDLNVGSSNITNAGLKELAGLKSLQSLDLSGTKTITDAGLKEEVLSNVVDEQLKKAAYPGCVANPPECQRGKGVRHHASRYHDSREPATAHQFGCPHRGVPNGSQADARPGHRGRGRRLP